MSYAPNTMVFKEISIVNNFYLPIDRINRQKIIVEKLQPFQKYNMKQIIIKNKVIKLVYKLS